MIEVGCGDGALARALAASGHRVVAIDPKAPANTGIFRRVALSELAETGPFDAVVASMSLHHIHPLPETVDRLVSLLVPHGLLLLRELEREALDDATLRWYFHQQHALAAVGRRPHPAGDLERFRDSIATDLDGIHPTAVLRAAVAERFDEVSFERVPYLHAWGLDHALEPIERELIERSAIRATGWWYAGRVRP